MGYETFDTTNDNKYASKNNRYKGREGETDRLSFIWFHGTEEGTPIFDSPPKFMGAMRLYHPDVGYVLDNGPEFNRLSVATGGKASKQAIATVVISWPTNRDGEIEKSRLAKGEFSIMPWIFSKDKYKSLKKTHDRFPFGSHDIAVDCSDAQYQKMTFTPERDHLFKLISAKNPDMAKRIVDQVLEVIGKLGSSLGQDLTLEEFKERLGRGEDTSNSFEGLNVSETDIGSVMDDILG